MSGKLCKKCGCVLFDQSSEYCHSCKPKEGETKTKEREPKGKKDFYVNNSSSKKLSTLDSVLMVVMIILLFVGVILSVVGADDLGGYYSDPTIFICGIVLLVSGLSIIIARIFINSLINITKCAEYYNARIEDEFNIK